MPNNVYGVTITLYATNDKLGKTMFNKLIFIPLLIVLYLTSCADRFVPEPNQPISPLLATPTRHLVPTYTPTATFTPTPLPTWTPMPAPTVANYFKVIQTKPRCTAIADYSQCYDAILDISFEYPTVWGAITATLGSAVDAPSDSGFSGYGYSYQFNHNFDKPDLSSFTDVIGSGRSTDYSQPRGGWIGDFSGFREKTTDTFCNNFPSPALCEVVKPGVVLVFWLAEVQQLCDPMPGFPPLTGGVYVDLPHKRLINGFVFTYPLLSLQQEKSLYSILGIEPNSGPTKCDDNQARQQFDEQIQKLAGEISSRTGSDDVMQNVNTLIRLANSIEGQETNR